jgi:hypothetical protein
MDKFKRRDAEAQRKKTLCLRVSAFKKIFKLYHDEKKPFAKGYKKMNKSLDEVLPRPDYPAGSTCVVKKKTNN